MFQLGEKSLSYKNIYVVLSLKITKSTVFGKFFRRDTAVSCSMCKKLCPLACNARTKHMVNKANRKREAGKGRPSSRRITVRKRKGRGKVMHTGGGEGGHAAREKVERSWILETWFFSLLWICGKRWAAWFVWRTPTATHRQKIPHSITELGFKCHANLCWNNVWFWHIYA